MAKQEVLNFLAAFIGVFIGQIICVAVEKSHKRRVDKDQRLFLEGVAETARQNLLLKEENEALKRQASEREVTR